MLLKDQWFKKLELLLRLIIKNGFKHMKNINNNKKLKMHKKIVNVLVTGAIKREIKKNAKLTPVMLAGFPDKLLMLIE